MQQLGKWDIETCVNRFCGKERRWGMQCKPDGSPLIWGPWAIKGRAVGDRGCEMHPSHFRSVFERPRVEMI